MNKLKNLGNGRIAVFAVFAVVATATTNNQKGEDQ
jgi:hypothetical protein